MKNKAPAIRMIGRELLNIEANIPDNRDISGITLDFSIKFTPVTDGKFSISIGVLVAEIEEGEDPKSPFMKAEMIGFFSTPEKNAKKTDHFIAINMVYPELRLLCVRLLDYMRVDAGGFPLSVPSGALDDDYVEHI